jgi:ATP/maltotriose-dependent transcriptional regulator MalT/DNA-binding SARP family transcriptional activator
VRPTWPDNVDMPDLAGAEHGGAAVPPLPGSYVPRPSLSQALDAAVGSRLTVVSGAAGWGKSTAVAGWAGRRGACWLTLERADSAVPQLANRILQAARHRLPELPAGLTISTGPTETGPQRAPVGAVVDALCRLLAGRLDRELILVLDGMQELAPAGGDTTRLLAGLCRQGPPELRLVVITQQATGRWPTPEPAAEIGPELLAFTAAEVAAFLTATPGVVDPAGTVDPAWVAETRALTGGWPVAVRLAAELLRTGGAGALPRLPPGARVLEELAARVVAAESEPSRRLLVAAAVLGRVDAPMCAALGHPDAAAALSALAEHGLLRRGGPDNGSWLILDAVREVVSRGVDQGSPRVREIHRSAAGYLTRTAEYGPALQHLVAAGDGAAAQRLLVEHGEALLADGEVGTVLSAAQALDLRGPDPHLLAILGYARHLHGDWLDALTLLQAAAGDGSLEPALALRLGQLHYVSGRPEEAVEVFRRARLGAGASPDEVGLLCHAAIWLRAVGADDLARSTSARAAAAAERCADPAAAARSHWTLAIIAADDGDRAAHDMHHRRGLRLAGQLGDTLLQLGLHINHASYLAEDGSPAEALAEAEAALRLGQELGVIGYEPLCYSIRARAKARLGQFEPALADVATSQQQWQDIGPSFDVAFGLIVRGDIHRRRGEPGQAQAALVEALRFLDSAGMRSLQALALPPLARARAADDLAAAVQTADRAVAVATGTGKVAAVLAHGWVALLAGDRAAANRDAAAARAVAGARRDRAGLAEALELAVLAAAEPAGAVALLDEAAALWAELDDPIGDARVRLIAARLAGPSGRLTAEAVTAELQAHGLRVDSGVADALAVPAPQPLITVQTLGEFRVLRRGLPIPSTEWRSKKARDLFKILVTYRGRPATRERLMNLLWPDDPADRTANRLSVLLSTLRTVLDPERAVPEPGPILADRHTVTLDLALVVLDIDVFLTAAADALAADRRADPAAARLLAIAETGYTGGFLPEDPYGEWADPLRDTARTTHIAILRALTRHATDADQRERHLLQLLDHDPYDEQAHQSLVSTLNAAGRHGEARRRYHDYAARMAEIGVTPAPLQRPGPDNRSAC